MIIRAVNSLADSAAYSYLSNGEAVGASALRVKNINAYQADWAIQVGATGEEQSEIVLISGAPSGTSVSLTGTTRFSHPTDSPVYAIKYDQVVFERSTAGTAGTASPLSSGTLSITPDSTYTQFDDTSGLTTYAYKVYFRNSVTAGTSIESDWLTSSGFSFYSLAKMRSRVKNKLFSANFIKDDSTIDEWINEWLETMNNVAIDVNKDYSLGTVNVGFSGTAELGTITSTDFKELRKVLFTTNGTDFYLARKMAITDFIPQQTYSETHPAFYMQGDNIIGRKPADSSGTAQITYYKTPAVLVNDTDELPVSMRAYTKSFVSYGLSVAYYLDSNMNMGDRFRKEADTDMAKFRSEITPRSKTGPQTIIITDSIDGDDDFELFI